jgi:hypothetical protein
LILGADGGIFRSIKARFKMNPPPIQSIDLVNLAIQFAMMALAFGLPIRRMVVTGLFWSSFFRMWMGLVIWAVLFCLIVPLFITFAFHQKHVFERFPDGRGIIGMLFMGWFPCMIVFSITWAIRTILMQFRARSNSN